MLKAKLSGASVDRQRTIAAAHVIERDRLRAQLARSLIRALFVRGAHRSQRQVGSSEARRNGRHLDTRAAGIDIVRCCQDRCDHCNARAIVKMASIARWFTCHSQKKTLTASARNGVLKPPRVAALDAPRPTRLDRIVPRKAALLERESGPHPRLGAFEEVGRRLGYICPSSRKRAAADTALRYARSLPNGPAHAEALKAAGKLRRVAGRLQPPTFAPRERRPNIHCVHLACLSSMTSGRSDQV
jgi:hypothetical protein